MIGITATCKRVGASDREPTRLPEMWVIVVQDDEHGRTNEWHTDYDTLEE